MQTETLSIEKKAAIAAYNRADENIRKFLTDLFPGQSFSGKIEDRIFSLEDACKENGTDLDDAIPYKAPKNDKQKCINAFSAMIEIIQAFNEQKIPDWNNTKQYKRYPWWNMNDGSSASGLSLIGVGCGNSPASVASRLILLNEAHVRIVAERFFHIYEPLMTQKQN